MGLLDDILSAQAVAAKGPACSVRLLLDDWSCDPVHKQDAVDLRAALEDPRIQHTTIRSVLLTRGVALADSTIGRHRGGKCRCGAE